MIYTNHASDARVQSVSFAQIEGRQFCFLQFAKQTDTAQINSWLSDPTLSLRSVSTTENDTGSLLVVENVRSPHAVLNVLARHGEKLEAAVTEKKFDPWKWRAATSVIGQGLQIWSGKKSVGSKSDARSVIGFASLNMAANLMNWIFGAQEKHDPHQLRFLKEQLNQQLAPLVGIEQLPAANERRLMGRPTEHTKKSIGQKTYSFLQRYSVTGGEIGLRVLGSAALVVPHPVIGARKLWQTKSVSQAFQAAKNPTVTFYVGLTMLAGKFVSLLAKEPDPYNPESLNSVRTFREKIAFPMSSVIEGGAAAYMGYDKVKNGRIKMNGTIYPDFLNGLGNASFIGGYVIRFQAPYGSLEVDMPELYAHVSDSIAKAPTDKISELVAQTAHGLAEHFKGQHTLAEIYAGITADLGRHHHIDVTKPCTPIPVAVAAKGTPVHHITYQDRLAAPAELAHTR